MTILQEQQIGSCAIACSMRTISIKHHQRNWNAARARQAGARAHAKVTSKEWVKLCNAKRFVCCNKCWTRKTGLGCKMHAFVVHEIAKCLFTKTSAFAALHISFLNPIVGELVQSPRRALGLSPKRSSKPTQIEIWSNINLLSFYQILECQFPAQA